ncbi:hypothetical protein, partial [Paraburkholderia sp. SIMBA_054]|uniref:hypothetical protein n=1 Tax=Paraburkholderia sp. SIMBA_054 TaxID=3085795 RepID=UPI00397A72FB
IALLIVGAATAVWQEQAILWIMLAGLLSMAVAQSLASPVPLQSKPVPRTQKGPSATAELLKSKGFLTVLLVSILLQGAHAAYYNY